jgi:SAM-dependent methyltransferase
MRPEPGGGIGIRGLDVHGGCPFEELTLDETFDFIYSVSVLEHVMKPEAVVRQMRRLLKPGGHACHSVDLRDHASFDDPLRFLRMAEGEYAGQATENRLRASDWFRLFDAAGFRLLECEYATYDQPGGLAASYSWAPPAPQAWVQAQQRDSFVAPFTEKTPQDLSVLAIRILYERT